MQLRTASLIFLVLPGFLHAQSVDANRLDIRSHFIGEPVARFLRLEPDARAALDVCRQQPARPNCGHLVDAVESNLRAEISTAIPRDIDNPGLPESSIDFILDKGKVVKISVPVNDVPELLKKFGAPTRETTSSSHNNSGAKWDNHTSIWETPGVYVSLFQDNNPSLEDHRPLLVMESPEEHAAESPAPSPVALHQ